MKVSIQFSLFAFLFYFLLGCSDSIKENIESEVNDDTTPPQINLIGESYILLEINDIYIEQGAEATDTIDGDLTVTVEGTVDTSIVGEYVINYSATDKSGNTGTISRTIDVEERSENAFIVKLDTEKNDPFSDPDDDNAIERTVDVKTDKEYEYDFSIKWGDGSIDQNVTDSISHQYAEDGIYEVAITGKYPRPVFNECIGLVTVVQWGNSQWLSLDNAFLGDKCYDIVSAIDAPDLSLVTSLSGMFAYSGINIDINHWNVSTITNMAGMFLGAELFQSNLSRWDVSNVTNMSGMFSGGVFTSVI